jgi:hypothetical protein
MSERKHGQAATGRSWIRIPDGTKVRHRSDGHEGYIDGLTEIVTGPRRNPDGRTQYRLNIGEPDRILAVEEDLLILTDKEGLVLMAKQKVEYRCHVTEQLHAAFANDRFVASR